MATVSLKDLIRAGVHFGHRTSRWNPKMAPYIFKKRNLIHIIDVKQTLRGLLTGRRVTAAVAERGAYVLFVGTKRQAGPVMKRAAERCGMPYVTERWPGGMLTNYATIRQRLERLQELESLEETGQIQLYSKKMISSLRRERRKIERNLGGVREMTRLPGLVLLVDPNRENIAIKEALKLNIPTIAWMDTDGNPENIDVVIPANDDAIGSVEIFAQAMAEAVLAGRERAEVGHRGAPPQATEPQGEAQPAEPAPAAPEPQPELQPAETVEAAVVEPVESQESAPEPEEEAAPQ